MAKFEKLLKYLEPDMVNIADTLDKEQLRDIGHKVCDEYKIDKESRYEWEQSMKIALDLAKQRKEEKTFPWVGASNVKFPLVTNAGINFASRVLPTLTRGERVVEVQTIGDDPDGSKEERAARVADHMSYQLLVESDNWLDDKDKMLHTLPIVGTVFHKIYYDNVDGMPKSEMCEPSDLIVNNSIKSLKKARRITHRVYLYKNDIIERQNMGLFLDMDLDFLDSMQSQDWLDDDMGHLSDAPRDKDPQHCILEQHRFLDLDGDGYAEPYICMVHKDSEKVFGIYPRFNQEGIKINSEGDILKIEPIQSFVDYHFIPSPDGKYYSIGFGILLAPINESINTLLNQLIDSGSLANTQGGFVGRGLKIKGGVLKYRMGEWQVLDVGTATNIKDNIFPLPMKEPSSVLFQLLGLLIEAGKEIASINDTLTGEQQTQNSPATTTLAMIEQGLRVFSAISKRLQRSLKKEFKALYNINRLHLTDADYARVLDNQLAIVRTDYESRSNDISPVADPTVSSDAQKYAKSEALLQIPQAIPTANIQEIGMRYLKALEIRQPEKILPPPDPNAPPPPEVQKVQMEATKMQMDGKAKELELEMEQKRLELEALEFELKKKELQLKIDESSAKIAKMEADASKDMAETAVKDDKAQSDAKKAEAMLIQAKAVARGDKGAKES